MTEYIEHEEIHWTYNLGKNVLEKMTKMGGVGTTVDCRICKFTCRGTQIF